MMDEKYFVYFDDTDFSFRILKDGRHKIVYCPNVKLFHKVGTLTKSFYKDLKSTYRGNFFLKQNTRNHIYFLKKVGGFFAWDLLYGCFLRIMEGF